MGKVLVLDCWMRKGLSVVRGLGRGKLEIHISGHKRINPALYSTYTKKFILFPNPEADPEGFKQTLLAQVKKVKYDCIFPLEEGTIELVNSIRFELEHYTRIPVVGAKTFEKAVDKWNSLQLARSLGVPVPQSYCPQNDREVTTAIKKIGFPLIIKPRKTSGGRGLKKITSQKEFDEHYPEVVKEFGRPMIQEYIGDGPGVLVWYIADKKKILSDFSYERLRKFPIDSGPGTMWVSTHNKLIIDYGAKISRALNWEGIIIVEFKMDPKDNKPKFMEINPRMGGSSAQGLFCGVNFPLEMYLHVMGKSFKKPTYAVGRKTRWLVADVMHFLSNRNRWQMNPSFFDFTDTYFEEFDRTDIRGNVWVIIVALLNAFDIEIWKKGVLRKK